jgi:hypothetical protein
VCTQVMREQHRLSMLKVRPAGHRCVRVRLRLVEQRVNHLKGPGSDPACRVTKPHSQQRRNLIVPGTAGTQPTAEIRASPLDQAPLQGGVHVLILRCWNERAGIDIGIEVVQRAEHRGKLIVVEQPSVVQHPGMCPGTADVIAGQTPIEVG